MSGLVQVIIDNSSDAAFTGKWVFDAVNGGEFAGPSGTSLPASAVEGSWFWKTDTKSLYRYNGASWDQIASVPALHAASHINGTDDIALATPSTKGLMSGTDKGRVDSMYTKVEFLTTTAGEVTGFLDPAATDLTYDPATRKVTLSGTVAACWRSVVVPSLVNGWVSEAHGTGYGSHYLYYNGTAFVWTDTPWTFDMLQIAYVDVQPGYTVALKECHGIGQWQWHQGQHNTIGTYTITGGVMNGLVINSTTPADRRPVVTECMLHDEDCPTLNAEVSSGAYTTMRMVGTQMTAVTDRVDVIHDNGSGRPYYNALVSNVWSDVLFPANNYGKVFLMGIPAAKGTASQKMRWLWIQPQLVSATLSVVEDVTSSEVFLDVFGDGVPEYTFLGEIIIRYVNPQWRVISYKTLRGGKVFQVAISGNGGVTDHGQLSGLGDDDHAQYLRVSGSRAMTGDLNMGGFSVSSVNLVDGVDVSAHATRHGSAGADAISIAGLSGEAASPQKVQTLKGGASVGSRPALNLIEGSNVSITAVDDAGNNRVNVTIAAAGSASPLTTKGDLFSRDATQDARLPVGSAGQILSVDANEATGLKWIPGGGAAYHKYEASVMAQINSTLGLLCRAPANTNNPGGIAIRNPYDSLANGQEDPFSVSGNQQIIGANIMCAAASVSTGTVSGNPTVRLDIYSIASTTDTFLATVRVPISNPATVGVWNNLGNSSALLVGYLDLTGTPISITDGMLIGWNFVNESGDGVIGAVSRLKTVITSRYV